MKIYKDTVSDLLWDVLSQLMSFQELKQFRLVGGTSLSLLFGHRMSVDIDLFTDVQYGDIDFYLVDKLLENTFDYFEMGYDGDESFGKMYYVGKSKDEVIKVDLFYTEKFIAPVINYKNIRLSKLEDIVAMKLEVIGNNGRKKDFWDIHELMGHFTWEEMFNFYEKKYPYGYSKKELLGQLMNFGQADNDFEPICLKNKYWELIKLDIEQSIRKYHQ